MRKPRKPRRRSPEEIYFLKTHGRAKTKPHVSNVFCRVNNRRRWINALSFQEAGYPSVQITMKQANLWKDIHQWCQENIPEKYTWTGMKFWFLHEADKKKFEERWT